VRCGLRGPRPRRDGGRDQRPYAPGLVCTPTTTSTAVARDALERFSTGCRRGARRRRRGLREFVRDRRCPTRSSSTRASQRRGAPLRSPGLGSPAAVGFAIARAVAAALRRRRCPSASAAWPRPRGRVAGGGGGAAGACGGARRRTRRVVQELSSRLGGCRRPRQLRLAAAGRAAADFAAACEEVGVSSVLRRRGRALTIGEERANDLFLRSRDAAPAGVTSPRGLSCSRVRSSPHGGIDARARRLWDGAASVGTCRAIIPRCRSGRRARRLLSACRAA
jgi:hypothetical protein